MASLRAAARRRPQSDMGHGARELILALWIEKRPELSYRDVQAVLAHTARKTDPSDPGWVTNAAGLHHNIKYGFGLVDAAAAVEAAST